VNGNKNGETLKLFQDYTGTKNGAVREELLEKAVARVLSILLKQEKPDGRFQQLIEARRHYPTAFQDVVIVVCRSLEIPTGLRSLLELYAWTRDLALRDQLLEIREEAFNTNRWDVLEPFVETKLMQEFADLAQERRSK